MRLNWYQFWISKTMGFFLFAMGIYLFVEYGQEKELFFIGILLFAISSGFLYMEELDEREVKQS